MVGNAGVYGTKKFENLDYDSAIATADIAALAVTASKLSLIAKRKIIVVQDGAAAIAGALIPKPTNSIYIESIMYMGKNKAATSVASFKPVLAIGGTTFSGAAATTTVTGEYASGSTAVGSTCATYMVATFPATTYMTDARGMIIQYYEED
jgi:hypothetical protein